MGIRLRPSCTSPASACMHLLYARWSGSAFLGDPALCFHSSQLLYMLFSLPGNISSFFEVWINVLYSLYIYISVQFTSVTQACLILCDPMNRSTPGLPVHHHLPEFTQTHVHRVSHAIQPSHPLSSPFPPAPNPSQHQDLFK